MSKTQTTDIETIREALNEEYSHRDGYGCEHLSKALSALDRVEANCLPKEVTHMRLTVGNSHVLYFDNSAPDLCDGPITRSAVIAAIEKIEGDKK